MTTSGGETDPLLSKSLEETSGQLDPKAPSVECKPPKPKRNCFLVEPIVVLWAVSVFPVGTISQRYILDWFTANSQEFFVGKNITPFNPNETITPCQVNTSDPSYAFQEYVQSKSSDFGLYESVLSGVPALFMTILLGAGSDRFGRRFAIIPPLLGTVVCSAIVTAIIWTKASIYWFFLKDVFSGLSGSFASILMGCFAYVADRTPPEKRMIRIVIVEMCLLLSGLVFPMIMGKVLTSLGYVYPLLFVVAVSGVNFLYVLFFFPKHTKCNAEPASESNSSCDASKPSVFAALWAQLRSMFSMFIEKRPDMSHVVPSWRRLKLNVLLLAFFITNLPTFDLSVSTLFAMNSPLCWDIDTLGIYSGLSSGISGVGALIMAPLFKKCGVPDFVVAIIAGLASLATSAYKAFVTTTLMMFLTLSLSMLRILFIPSLRSLLSNQVNEDQQGAIFGAIACLEVVCWMIGTVVFNTIYSATLFISTGFVFLVMAAFYAAGCLLVCVYAFLLRLDMRRRSDCYSPINDS